MPADPSKRSLSIHLPESIQTEGGSSVLELAIVDDDKIQGGRRAIQRSYRPSNVRDPGRIRGVEWNIWGPIGNSLESSSGLLATDFAQNMETRWDRRLLAGPLQTYVDLTPFDPAGRGSYFGTAIFGSSYFGSGFGSGGSGGTGPDVIVFAEQQGLLYAYRGTVSTQISIGPFIVLSSVTLPATILDADHWRSHIRVAIGSTAPMQTLVSASPGVQNYEDTTSTTPSGDVYAYAVKRGSDRAWYIDADSGNSMMGYTLDAFVNLANPFQVGDPDVRSVGIGPFGFLTMIGALDNLYSFTDQGKPVPLSRALYSHHSPVNGLQWADPGWGWNYAITAIGLRAIQPGVDNPVGVGERMRMFTGHSGVPIAVYAERGELWVVYQTPQGAYYGYRGAFGPETANTGQPAMFPWFYETQAGSHALFSSTTNPTSPEMFWMIRSRGTDMAVMSMDAAGRDDINPGYQYSRAGGAWYGTTLDRDANLLKTLRLIRGRARNMTAGSTFTIGVGFDTNPIAPASATYTTIGTVDEDGFFTLVPNQGGADSQGNPTPTADISGRTAKPRVTLEAGTWAEHVLSLSPKAYWPLGEASGDAQDESGNNNDGTVTLGAGERDTEALNADGDGSITYDGSATSIAVATSTSLTNIWDAGGTITFMTEAAGPGEGDEGMVIAKGTRWFVNLLAATASVASLRFTVDFSTTDGIWTFTEPVAYDDNLMFVLTYNADNVANVPTLTVYNRTTQETTTYTAVVTQAPVGTRVSDTGTGITLGNNAGGTATFDGLLDEIALFTTVLTADQIEQLIQVNASTISPELDGTLEVMYDERPDMIEEVEVVINITGTNYSDNYIWDTLKKLVGENTTGPFQIQLPDDQPPAVSAASGGGAKYAMVADVKARQDTSDNSIEAVTVTLHVWPRGGVLE